MSDAAAPRVSVLLPVRNGGDWFALALGSILDQQDCDFELIVIDDGSSDGTSQRLAACPDPRLRVLRREGGGLVAALNAGLALARGTYVARMDADDISLPGRLAGQAAVLDADAAAVLVHGSVDVIDANGRRIGEVLAQPCSPEDRRAELMWERDRFPIIHPAVMIRRSVLVDLGGYRHSPSAEDHELWLRLLRQGKIVAQPDKVLLYRQHEGGISRERAVEQAISSLVNCTCARWFDATGRDLYAEDPVLYALLRSQAETIGTAPFGHLATARAVRIAARSGQVAAALRGAIHLISGGKLQLLGKSAIRRLHVGLQKRLFAWLRDHENSALKASR